MIFNKTKIINIIIITTKPTRKVILFNLIHIFNYGNYN